MSVAARPRIWWIRRDLRLSDNQALSAAARGGPVIPIFICDAEVDALGAAAKWRLGAGLEVLGETLRARGSRLILERGAAGAVLQSLIAETGASEVHWQRVYDPAARARDSGIKAELKASDIVAESHAGQLLHEPWNVKTGAGGYYKVFTPFWKAIRGVEPGAARNAPAELLAPEVWPKSEALADWKLGAGMKRGHAIVAHHHAPGEAAAQARLAAFLDERMAEYPENRDALDREGTSGLSDYLTFGEISPRQIWQAGARRRAEGAGGAEAFLRQVAWRDFAHHLMFHDPRLLSDNWREGWGEFPWITDPDHPHLIAWQRGRTGIDLVDAAMRELYVTGKMHNRARMLSASYLTKHLMIHWKLGMEWFAECLTDHDPANNAMGWQWVAGTGPDASPYFRIFNPDTQAAKFDPKGRYRDRWLAEGQAHPGAEALAFYDAIPQSWGLSLTDARPEPLVPLAEGRARALEAYSARKSG